VVISLTLVLIALSSSANADRGMVSLQGISVYEPGQKAIIAWNGSEEILILSTDVHSESNTSVLEILPLPSMPNVTLGNFSSFYKIQELIWYHSYYKSVEDRNYYLAAAALGNESVEVVFQQKVGLHNITIVHIKSNAEYAAWIDNFLIEKNVSNDVLPAPLNALIAEYLNLGISYFVFDELELTPAIRSIEPIIYRFSTTCLYYPLRISSIVEGNTTVTLFCITDQIIDWSSVENLGFNRKIEFDLNKTELLEIEPKIGEMFGSRARLYVCECSVALQTLISDIRATAFTIVIQPTHPQNILQSPLAIATFLTATAILLGLFFSATELGKYKLFAFLIVPLFTKLKKEAILDHYTRGRIHGFIEANPGAHFNLIKRTLGLNNGTLSYHLRVLEKSGLIKHSNDGFKERFYPIYAEIPIVPYLSSTEEAILEVIKATPGITQKELKSKLNLSQPLLSYYTTKLAELELLEQVREGKEIKYYLKEKVGEGNREEN
ncbi:MAG: DUF2330 domain-containing protein, partial [Candidatus Thermoplasmatota archaeon]|nr:DUF2330 domain-containing protein [Candidatus Thermoplasmatota archaeon]